MAQRGILFLEWMSSCGVLALSFSHLYLLAAHSSILVALNADLSIIMVSRVAVLFFYLCTLPVSNSGGFLFLTRALGF